MKCGILAQHSTRGWHVVALTRSLRYPRWEGERRSEGGDLVLRLYEYDRHARLRHEKSQHQQLRCFDGTSDTVDSPRDAR